MPVAGARALLSSAKKPVTPSSCCRLPRVANGIVSVGAAAAVSTSRANQLPLHQHHRSRGFHSSPARARPDDSPNKTEEKKEVSKDSTEGQPPPSPPLPPAAPSSPSAPPPPPPPSTEQKPNNRAVENTETSPPPAPSSTQQPPPPPPSNDAAAAAAAKREKLRSQGYGSARARATRTRVEEVPPLTLPSWFNMKYIKIHDRLDQPHPPLLSQEDKEALLARLDKLLDDVALTEEDVAALGREWVVLKHFGSPESNDAWAEEQCDRITDRVQAVLGNLYLQILATIYRPGVDPAHLQSLKESHALATMFAGVSRPLWWSDEEISGEARKWLSYVKPEWGVPKSGELHASPLARRPDSEYTHCVELLAAVRTALRAPLPELSVRGEARRPVAVLPVLNCKAPGVAFKIVDDVAADLEADVVHLDAFTLARIVGKYLNQNLFWSRGPISMLGYAAAEMNGRIAPRTDVDPDNEVNVVAVSLPPRFRSFLKANEGLSGTTDNSRWEDLKLMSALESLISAVDGEALRLDPSPQKRDLIVHLHDYVELNSLQPSLVSKIRTLVDRMWGQGGRRVVVVGSSAGDMHKSNQWKDQLLDIAREGNHVIPFHFGGDVAKWEASDNLLNNIYNIQDMVEATLGSKVEVTFTGFGDDKYRRLVDAFRSHLFDIQWVYRFASAMIGGRERVPERFTIDHMLYALDVVADSNARWSNTYSTSAPYHSPIHIPRPGGGSSMSGFFSQSSGDWGGSSSSQSPANLPNGANAKDLDQYEKKLLSGLINAEDIHTTFNDIIVPKETKESLIGLTSLSLTRPDAFTYGVLKTERIPGCLLYGPPGTGKTLLAKAVAKESGANMLEVSAASINDMWLGQSEKNVRALFSLARKMSPMVIFLDEADALLGARQQGPGRTGHRETITQFLREWDGVSDMRAFIMVATNRPFDLDEAVLRRLPRKILVDLPLAPERESILRVMLKEETLADDVDLAQLAKETDLYSGSDLKNLCVSAAMEAVREEVRQQEAWTGEGEYVFPERRVLGRKHFDKGMKDISASISEDMDSLKAIRKFDEQYGDSGRRRKGKKKGMGFEVVTGPGGTEEVRVRQVVAAAVPSEGKRV